MYERTDIREVEQRDEAYIGRATEIWRLLANLLELHIDELTRTVEGLSEAPYCIGLADTVQLVDDLRAKVERLQWLFRIAKHLKGDARDRVMATVCKLVDDLESALETQMHANAMRAAA